MRMLRRRRTAKSRTVRTADANARSVGFASRHLFANLAPSRLFVLLSAALLAVCVPALAKPTQEEVLRSINENVGAEIDPKKLLAALIAVVGLIVIVVLLNYRQKRAVLPKVLNHVGKLTKEVARAIELKPAELKQLRALAEEKQLSSPLVLLLCPSLLSKPPAPAPTPAASPTAT